MSRITCAGSVTNDGGIGRDCTVDGVERCHQWHGAWRPKREISERPLRNNGGAEDISSGFCRNPASAAGDVDRKRAVQRRSTVGQPRVFNPAGSYWKEPLTPRPRRREISVDVHHQVCRIGGKYVHVAARPRGHNGTVDSKLTFGLMPSRLHRGRSRGLFGSGHGRYRRAITRSGSRSER